MDRRTIGAILLMMVIAVAPALFLKKPNASSTRGGALGQRGGRADSALVTDSALQGRQPAPDRVSPPKSESAAPGQTAPLPGGPAASSSEDTVQVTSPLYRYGV